LRAADELGHGSIVAFTRLFGEQVQVSVHLASVPRSDAYFNEWNFGGSRDD
jgi:hypothetical protein